MLITIPGVLDEALLAQCRDALAAADWADGRGSAGYLSRAVKNNSQLADADPTARRLGELILSSLEMNSTFVAATLPLKVLPPLFNRYSRGQAYGAHIDGAIRPVTGTHHRVRTDLSATIFLSDPASYTGGELVIRDTFGERTVKLEAGDLVLYPGTSVHRVEPVTSGERLAAFFWIQSMVRDTAQRTLLFDLDAAIQRLANDVPGHAALVDLAGIYHNLLRAWADS